MPFSGEVAGPNSQVATARDALVLGALGEYRVAEDAIISAADVADLVLPLSALTRTGPGAQAVAAEDVDTCLGIDGSRQETTVMRDGSRRATVCYIRVGVAALDLDAMREINRHPHIDPVALRRAEASSSLNYALPGVGVMLPGLDAVESWRAAVDRMLGRCVLDAKTIFGETPAAAAVSAGEQITLAEALLTMYRAAPSPSPVPRDAAQATVPVRRCPVCGATGAAVADQTGGAWVGRVGADGGGCEICGGVLYLADALNVDEALATNGRDQAMNTVMNAVERLTLIAIIEMLRRTEPAALSRTLIVADGPLAAIGSIQGLATPMLAYLDQVASELAADGLPPMLIVGVEKTGGFAQYGSDIAEIIEPGHVMRLPTDYIARHITGRSRSGSYGVGHLYGRRFFYRRRDGGLLTVTVPAAAGVAPWSGEEKAREASEAWGSYPTLRTVLERLEGLREPRYPDALSPLSRAHEASSIGNQGQTVLGVLAQQSLGITQNTRLRRPGRF